MKIGINGQNLLGEHPAGPERYNINIIRALAKIDHANEYVVYLPAATSIDFCNYLSGHNPKVSFKVISSRISWTHVGLSAELFRHPVDVFFTSIHTMPLFRPTGTRFVGMIHGLEYGFAVPRNFLSKLLQGAPEWFVCAFAHKIIVPSFGTKSAILAKNWPLVKENKLQIIYEGLSEDFFTRSAIEIVRVRQTYDLGTAPYLVFVSTIQPRKNIPKMIEAFAAALASSGKKNVKLVIAGKKGWQYEESLQAPKRFGVDQNVVFVGHAPDYDLAALLSGSIAFINCSLEEGFGLPLLEAMACGTRCIVSDISAFKEIGGDVPYYVSPDSEEEIKSAILKVLAIPDDERKMRGIELARQFTWERAAEQTLEVFKGLASGL